MRTYKARKYQMENMDYMFLYPQEGVLIFPQQNLTSIL